MRSGIHGTIATLLLIIPVLSIPALAIFGIPQFAPVVASPLDEGLQPDRERRVGQSERPAAERRFSDDDQTPDEPGDFSKSRDDTRLAYNAEPRASEAWDEFSSNPKEQKPGKLGESVPISGAGRNAPAWDAAQSETRSATSRAASWADGVSNDGRPNLGADSRNRTSNLPADRSGLDPRLTLGAVGCKTSRDLFDIARTANRSCPGGLDVAI